MGDDERGGGRNKRKGPLTKDELFPSGGTHEENLARFAPKVPCGWCRGVEFWQATRPGGESVVRCVRCRPGLRDAPGGRMVRSEREDPLWAATEDGEELIRPEDRKAAGEPEWWRRHPSPPRLPPRPAWTRRGAKAVVAPARIPNPLFKHRDAGETMKTEGPRAARSPA